jgi:peptidoglycan/xylan/chitin deacetylase (PgdA/CDA1 family)
VSRRLGRLLKALLLPLSLVPLIGVAPLLANAYTKFDRRHKSGPLAPPAVVFTAREQQRYVPQPVHPGAIPVLTYHGINEAHDGYSVSPVVFARQMAMLRRSGFRTVSIADYVRFLRGERVVLPQRPILVTFDDGRLDSFRGADKVLQRYQFKATMFVIAGQVRPDSPFYLSWKELRGMEDSGRWDLQEHAGDGHTLVSYDQAGNTGPFYAYRKWTRSGGRESLAAWEQRVTTDIFKGRRALAAHLPDFRPWTFAIPYGNYGQRGTNDARIPALLKAFLARQFEATFVQKVGNYPRYTSPRAHRGDAVRFEVHTDTTTDDLFRWLRDQAPAVLAPAAAPAAAVRTTPTHTPTQNTRRGARHVRHHRIHRG